MKKYFISIVFSLIMMGFGITGCGEKAEELHVAVVGGACANSAQVWKCQYDCCRRKTISKR